MVQNCRMSTLRIFAPLGLALTCFCVSFFLSPPAHAAHGYALWGDLKYPQGFSHFDYVNPQAPQGGDLALVSNLRTSNYDKYNPFTIKGSAPAYLSDLLFDSLLTPSLDESASAYGLLADDVQVAADGLSVTFHLNPKARFHNGKPVQAADVLHSYNTLIGPDCSPAYKTLLAGVKAAVVLNAQSIRFDLLAPDRQLPLLLGSLPIFSRDWGKGKPFAQVVLEPPIGSGPYRIGPVVFGRDITYVRDKNYWGSGLNVRVGSFNFKRISVKIYQDQTARLEALKAGEFDLMRFFSARDWARQTTGKRFSSGELVKAEFTHQLPTGFQSTVLNTRRPLLQDIRVRQALALAMDYEWMNRQLFYGAYSRVQGIFGNTDCQASGLQKNGLPYPPPHGAELALLAPYRKQLPAAVFGTGYIAPRTDTPAGLRGNLRLAQALLHAAGWRLGADNILRNAQGQKLELEYLDSGEASMRTVTPWARNLAKLGIVLSIRPTDFALYQARLQTFDFDMTTIAYGGSLNPGQEYAEIFGSRAADTPDSGNYAGVKSPVVDALVARMVAAQSKADLLPACRALDRVIAHSNYLIPQWAATSHRIVYNTQHLSRPATMPPYAPGEDWAIQTWWAKASQPQPPQSE